MHLSLWLLPPSPVCAELKANIANLAEKYEGSAPFEPHVTVIGGRTMPCATYQDTLDIACRLGDGLKDFGGIPCRFHKGVVSMFRPDSTLVWNQACVSVMERSDEYMMLIKRSREILGIGHEPWNFPPPLGEPHFSHFYSEKFVPSPDDVMTPPDFIAEEAGLWLTSGGLKGVGTWEEVDRIKLCNEKGQ